MFKACKKLTGWALIAGLVLGGVGFLTFGTSFGSYIRTSLGMVKTSVKDSIPIPLEIQRARDMLEELIPEMRANFRLVANEEVEVANLENEIESERKAIESERAKLQKLRDTLKTSHVSYTIGEREYGRTELVTILSTQFDRLTTAEKFLTGKTELLANRKASLAAAMKNLERTRLARVELEARIESLEEQFRLMQLKSSGSDFRLDDTKLAQVERVIADLKKRLDVAQKIMASEARFIEIVPLEIPDVDESSVIERVDAYFLRADVEDETSVVDTLVAAPR